MPQSTFRATCLALLALVCLLAPLRLPAEPIPAPALSGLLQPGFAWTPDGGEQDGTFLVRRARLRASGNLGSPYLGYSLQIELATPQKPLRDAYVAVAHWGQEFRLGQFKVPFGWEGLLPLNRVPMIDQSVVQLLATPVNVRDIGVQIAGETELGEGWKFQNAVALVNGEGPNTRDVSPHKDVYARVGVVKKDRFWLGISGAGGETERDGGTFRTRRIGTDVGVHAGPFRLISEYVAGLFEDEDEVQAQAYYVLGIVRPIPELEILCRFEALAGDIEHVRFATGGMNFLLLPHGVRLQANYRHGLTENAANQVLAQAEYSF